MKNKINWSKIYSEPEKKGILNWIKNIIRNWISKRSANKSFKRMVKAAERLDKKVSKSKKIFIEDPKNKKDCSIEFINNKGKKIQGVDKYWSM